MKIGSAVRAVREPEKIIKTKKKKKKKKKKDNNVIFHVFVGAEPL
jgi:hypothetical protein